MQCHIDPNLLEAKYPSCNHMKLQKEDYDLPKVNFIIEINF